MAIREIVKEGYESLSKKSRPVTVFDSKLKALIKDLKDTLKESEGLGLAAPQVGVVRRTVVITDENERVIALINPVITAVSGEQEATEGCLSIPGVWGRTKRPAQVTVEAYDVNGEKFTLTKTGITAVCICHEVDHLDGILFRAHVTEYINRDENN